MTEKHRGRPPLDGTGTPSVRLEVRVTEAQQLRLRRVATRRGVRFSEVVREAIDDRLERETDRDTE